MFPFIISFLIAITIAPVVINLYKKNQWIDDPKKSPHAKKTHTQPVPRGGGIVVFFAMLTTALIFLQMDKYLVAIFLGGFLLTVVGFIDDILDIHPTFRIFSGITAALIVIGSGIGIAYVSNPFGPGVIHLDQPRLVLNFLGKERSIWILADLLALIFVMWNMNIINWSKGVDGQLPGFVSIASIIIGLLSLRFTGDPTQFNVAYLSSIVAGAYLGLLYWNWFPQKIMPGYGAGSLAGFFLSILAILSGAKVATLFMVLAIPTADGIFTISRRILAGKSPFWGDRGHLHHKLMDVFGWGKRRVAIFYWATSLCLGLVSLYMDTKAKIVALIITTSIVFVLLIWAKIRTSR
jgi:UDP-GlcNAc:undecaprenyl-phosphate/decaprenyl-phosphate GlcNAc-1-phosphate transferase